MSGYIPLTIEYKSTPEIAMAEPAIPIGVMGVCKEFSKVSIYLIYSDFLE
jgi:hypothetical protein